MFEKRFGKTNWKTASSLTNYSRQLSSAFKRKFNYLKISGRKEKRLWCSQNMFSPKNFMRNLNSSSWWQKYDTRRLFWFEKSRMKFFTLNFQLIIFVLIPLNLNCDLLELWSSDLCFIANIYQRSAEVYPWFSVNVLVNINLTIDFSIHFPSPSFSGKQQKRNSLQLSQSLRGIVLECNG